MATILKIKRSSTNPTATPSTLGQGELAYGEGTSTYVDAQGASVVSYGKLFIGSGTETDGAAAAVVTIGGKYFTDLLDHGHGTVTANSAAIVDSAKKVDVWNVDNITLDGNTLSTTNANGNFIIDTNGTGHVILNGSSTLGNNLFKINDGSGDRFVVDSFSGAIDITSPALSAADTLLNISSTWNNSGSIFYGIDLDVTNTASSSDSRLINLSVGGDNKFSVDLNGNVYAAGNISYGSATDFNIQDNTADAFVVKEGSNEYFAINTTDDSELLTLGNNLATVNVVVEDDKASAFAVKEGSNEYIAVDTTNGSELITFSTGSVDIDNNLNIDGGALTTNQATFNLLNTNATTVNFASAASAIDIGATTGTTSINNNLDVDGDLNVDGQDITTNETTFNLLNTNATTINAFGAATTLNIGSASTQVDFGDLRIVGSTIYSDNSGAQTITIDPFPAGGESGGNVVVRGNLQVSGTTTTVNSTQMTINDPVFTLGDSISEKTVVSAASGGQPDITLDDVEGLNVGDIVSGNAGIPGGTTISAINGTTITLSANLTAGIAASTNTAPQILTFTQGADDNKDRGIEFKYYNGGLKTGFFGYDESGVAEGDVTNYYFTYIPDATNTSQVFTGTVGSAYFNTVKLDVGITNGIPFFDAYKRITTTSAANMLSPGSGTDVTVSYQILTVTSAGVPVWTATIDGGTY